ncbi:hypothetical protein SAMN04487765_1677 [Tenacibaculum sp. MAR_2010_89]|uniref:hypothetical protein n=1 Tax=Tenacibaculum sp. MAR_2010_89 TaxID=1250198 RepID=UPI0008955D79|nr:hypothetical protein [Tenacibaculum sp. MAR_2010_89]SEE18252.1 hypothetical protein SAMN04487765_1677 [Tenacibaculum sp. MAR_2010_89]
MSLILSNALSASLIKLKAGSSSIPNTLPTMSSKLIPKISASNASKTVFVSIEDSIETFPPFFADSSNLFLYFSL